MSSLAQKFLQVRALMDSAAPVAAEPVPATKTISKAAASVMPLSVASIIADKPSKKVVTEFMKQRAMELTDDTDSDSDCA